MALSRRGILAATAALLARPALAQTSLPSGPAIGAPIRIGEINSYSTQPGFAEPYRKGWQLALKHVNDLGGINGSRLEFVSRDDGGDPAKALQLAAELVQEEHVALLAGGLSSSVGLGLSQYAADNKLLYVAGAPMTDALVWSKGNRYTYHVGPTTFMLAAMLIEACIGAPAKSWITVAPDTADGHEAATWFRKLLSAKRPDVSFTGEVWAKAPFNAADVLDQAGRTASDGVFNAIGGADLVALAQHAGSNPLFGTRTVAAIGAGDPAVLTPLGKQAPPGWFVTGYPWDRSDEPFNKQFVFDYTQAYGEPPTMGSVIGTALVTAITSGILKSGSTNSEAMASGFADAAFVTPFGICAFRAIDHQSTLGAYSGRTAQLAGQGVMADWRYVSGGEVMPPDADIRTLRPA